MGVLYLTKTDLDKYQRIMNKYAPYPTKVHFVDDYKISSVTKVSQGKAIVIISSFVAAFYNFEDRADGRQFFSDAILFHELAHLLYTDYYQLELCLENKQKVDEILHQAYTQYWGAVENQEDTTEVKALYKQAYIDVYYHEVQDNIIRYLEDAAIENSFFKQFPEYSDYLIYARKKIVEYEILENIYTKQKGLPVLLENINHYATCFYKEQEAFETLENHQYASIIKKQIIEARMVATDTKQRIALAKSITTSIKQEIEEHASKFFEENYQHIYGELEKVAGKENESMPSNASSQETKKEVKEVEQQEESLEKRESDIDSKVESEEDHGAISTMQNIVRKKNSEERFVRSLPKFTIQRIDELMTEAKQNAYLVQKRIVHKKRTQFKKKLDYGTRLDSKQLYRAKIDGRIYQISKKSKKTNVVVSILIDSSFSMQGKRQKMAIETAYKLGVMFQDLRIPFCIHGHSVGDDDITDFINYVPYEECCHRERLEEIFYLNTTGFTHEYIALKEALIDLSKHKRGTQKGLVIVISDAETESKKEIKEMCQRYKRVEDIDVLAIAVGKLGEVAQTYENYLYLPTTEHFFQSLVKEFERLAI